MANMLKVNTSEFTPLVSADQTPLDQIRVVLGWRNAGPVKARGFGALKQKLSGGPKVDLDAAALLCNARGDVISTASVDDLDPFRGAIVHQGDDPGKGTEASEEIHGTLSRLPDAAEAVVLTLASFTGAGFDKVNQTSFELYNGDDLRVQIFVPINRPMKNAAIMAVIRRNAQNREQWEIQEIGQLVYVDPHFGGNHDGAVSWKDLEVQHSSLFGARH